MLLEALLARDPHAPALTDPVGRVDAQAWRAAALGLRRAWPQARGATVALWAREPLAYLQALAALDGWAARVLLLPAETDAVQAAALMQRAGCSWLASDVPRDALTGVQLLTWSDAPFDDEPTESAVDSVWILATSGTTGEPKLVPHAPAALAATARVAAGVGATLHWALLYDPARFAGLQVVLQALLGGSRLAVPAAGQGLAERLDFFAAVGVNAVSATPTLWRKLLMLQRGRAPLALVLATLGGETADQPVLDAIQHAWPQARCRHVYASTEAGVGFSVADGREGFPAAWLDTPPPGVELRLTAGPTGDQQLLLRSARTAGAYLGGKSLRDGDGFVATGDAVRVAGERVLFLGRLGGAINVGGDKVWPGRVERVLLEHPGVAAAAVQGRKSAITGALVEAQVVARADAGDTTLLRADLLAHCRARLDKPAVPALIRFVPELAVTAAGKQLRSLTHV